MKDDLNKIFNNTDEKAYNEDVVIIRKSWRGHILPILILSFFIKSFFEMPFDDVFFLSLLAIALLCDQIARLVSGKLQINITTKEAKMSNIYGTHIVKNLQSVRLTKSPFLLFAPSVEVIGLNDGVGLASVKYSPDIERVLKSFQGKI